jgi:hypothetical protein
MAFRHGPQSTPVRQEVAVSMKDPGPAYERLKKMPESQKRHEETQPLT